jgi:hypothetical protein
MSVTFDDDGEEFGDSLEAARIWLREMLDEGVICPCCGQRAQRYRWTLPGSAVRYLLRMYELGGTVGFVESRLAKPAGTPQVSHIPAMWGLLEEERERRPDGGKSGWWRVTDVGERFIMGDPIPKYAYVYNGRVEGHDGSPQTISDRLGRPFNWHDHMNRSD